MTESTTVSKKDKESDADADDSPSTMEDEPWPRTTEEGIDDATRIGLKSMTDGRSMRGDRKVNLRRFRTRSHQ